MIVLYLVLGMFVDSLSLLVITLPTFYPIATGMGLDPVWFSIIAVKLVEIAAITPPVGLNLYTVRGIMPGATLAEVSRAALPFVAILILSNIIGAAKPSYIALPGGIGTMEEFFEAVTWRQLGYHNKPIAVLNIGGFYDGIESFFATMQRDGFLHSDHRDLFFMETNAARLLDRLAD